MLYGTRGTTGWTSITDQHWLNQFGEVTEAQRRESERRCHLHKNFGSGTFMRSFAQEKKSQQAPDMNALVRDRKVFAWCHKIN